MVLYVMVWFVSSGRIFILVSARYNHNAELVFCRDTFIFKQMYLSMFDY